MNDSVAGQLRQTLAGIVGTTRLVTDREERAYLSQDAFWDDAVEKAGNIPITPDVITFADAQKLGLNPGEAPIKSTGQLRETGALKKK